MVCHSKADGGHAADGEYLDAKEGNLNCLGDDVREPCSMHETWGSSYEV